MRKKIGRNQKCSCGSGKKYKNCHLHAGKPPTQVDTTRSMGAKKGVNLSGILSEIAVGPGYMLDTQAQSSRMKGRE